MSKLPNDGARAVHAVGADTITDLFRGRTYAVDSGKGKIVRTAEAARVIDDTLRKRIFRIIALFPGVELGWIISQATPSMFC